MLDILADTYRIATRTEQIGWPGVEQPARTSPSRKVPTAAPARPAGLFAAIAAWLKRRRSRARARAEVLAMSEHMLRDIGWNRYDLLKRLDGRN